MKSISLILFYILILCSSVLAQNILIVRDGESNDYLFGANIISFPDSAVLVSGANGEVDISEVKTGTRLSISFVGYKTITHITSEGRNIVYMEPDYQLLNELTVVGNDNEKKLYEIAGSYVINSRLVIDRFNDESLVRSMNTLPGIRFEERSPGSYRVSIRGNLLRAPFGVRNVKVYLNDIPYTDPTGSTPLNLLDLNNIGNVETLKGPAGSMYGAGIGGVLNIYSVVPKAKPLSADIGYSVGSYGFHKFFGNINSSGEDYRFTIRYAKQLGNGYRVHTNSNRDVIQMSCSLYPSEKRKLTAQILYSDLFYQLPGGLTKKQYNENPRQARPGVVEKNSSIDHKNFLAGLVQHYKWNEKIRNITSVYFSDGVKENPFVTNYELEKLKSLGSRTTFNISLQLGNLPMVFNVGAEINYGIFHATNHDNIDGYAGPLRYEDELKSLQTFVFFQAGLSLSEKWNLNLSASLNYLEYDIHRIRDVAQDTSYHINRIFNPEFIPRCGVVGKLNRELSLYGSVSAGFSPPTTEEIRTSDGGINDDLEAERAISFEVGIRGNNKSERLYYDASVFRMQQKETIVSKTTEEGTVVFENAGSTSQPGLELLLGYVFVKEPSSVISLLKLQASYTYHNFSFSNYEKRRGDENIDYSGNNLTGTALNIFVYTLDIESKGGGYLNFTYNYTDKIPLNDANTVFADSYQLITAKAGWKAKFRQKYLLEIFIGIDNLLNEKYSLGNDLNAFGERYYNAAPERNYYGGVKFLF